MSLPLSKSSRAGYRGMEARTGSARKIHGGTGQAQDFDSYSRRVPIQPQTARPAPPATPHSANIAQDVRLNSRGNITPAKPDKARQHRSEQMAIRRRYTNAETVAGRCDKCRQDNDRRSSFRVIALPTRTGFCFLSIERPAQPRRAMPHKQNTSSKVALSSLIQSISGR